MATSCAPALAPERLIDTTPMDPALLGENLRRNRLERTRSRQAEIRRGKLRETPGAAAKDEQGQGTTDETAALETTAVAAADSWSLEFAARQVQRRATQVGRPSFAAVASNHAASTVSPSLLLRPPAENLPRHLCSVLGGETRQQRHNVSVKPLWPRPPYRKLKLKLKLKLLSLRMPDQRCVRAQPGP